MARLWTRAIRPPPDDIAPNPNDPASVPPATVGPDQLVTPGDPHGVTVEDTDNPGWFPPRILPSAWSGWPAEWWPPQWNNGHLNDLVDTAWMCVDLNSDALASMPPYLVKAADTLNADWMVNPEPEVYDCWEDFARQLFWDFYATGEAFVLVTATYATGWPARFHVVPPWTVNIEAGDDGRPVYSIGSAPVPADDMIHLRYQWSIGDNHGHGPLEALSTRVVAARMLAQYGAKTVLGVIPPGILTHPEQLSAEQSALLQQQWVNARMSSLGAPAVLSGGIAFETTQGNPKDMALVEIEQLTNSKIAIAFGVPPEMMALPSGQDSLTYNTVVMAFVRHWRQGLRPKAQRVMSILSGRLLPRGTRIELNRDEYIEAEPLQRAQTAQILNSIVDPVTGKPALSVDEIRSALRLNNSTPTDVASGVLR